MTTESQYGWRAGVRENPVMMTLEVTIGEVGPEYCSYVTQITQSGIEREGFQRGTYDARSLNIPMDAARALYDALAQHFAGEAGSRQTRADLVDERKRVDKLIDVLSTVATREAMPMRVTP